MEFEWNTRGCHTTKLRINREGSLHENAMQVGINEGGSKLLHPNRVWHLPVACRCFASLKNRIET